ncbi:nucleotide pyrophosphohydrolase [Kribbella deserti]|uniref:Nucleotide pyrophosphohydrolase n=1 Tax=Kribbella deserti TaxID=1926257 RepID=A0ABV6QX95_9ACTN
MDFAEMRGRALEVRALYADWEVRRDGRAWSATELMNGFTGDVGDLAKLVGAHAGSRPGPEDLPAALGHELADCLWSVLVIADAVGVDLEQAFTSTMNDLEDHVRAQLAIEDPVRRTPGSSDQ